MTTPTWTPTPPQDLKDPAEILALYPDNTTGEIGADDLRAFAQDVYSAVDSLRTELADLRAVVRAIEAAGAGVQPWTP